MQKLSDYARDFSIFALFILIIIPFGISLAATSKTNFQPLIVAITINHVDTRQTAFVIKDNHNNIWVTQTDLQQWHLKIPAHTPLVEYQQKTYYLLNKLSGVSYRLDSIAVRLYLRILSQGFAGNRFDIADQEGPTAQRPQPGLFLNYDLFAQKQYGAPTYENGLFELGAFNRYGVGTIQFLVQNSQGLQDQYSQNLQDQSPTSLIRLNTQWNYDNPAHMFTLTLGDTTSVPGLWGNAVSFGGVRWGTNFATKPYFNPFPLPFIMGTAVVPSTASVYINNVLYTQRDLPPGPFTFNNIPVVNGAGQVQLVVTNPLGQQQVIMVPYFTNNQILRAGLHDYSVSLGFLRQNYGVISNDYGQLIASVTDTYGYTDRLTTQWHLEAQTTHLQAGGVGASWQIGNIGVLSAASAVSHSDVYGSGTLGLLSFTRQTQELGYGLNVQMASPHFTQIGQMGDDYYNLFPKLQIQAFYTFQLGKGSVGFSYINQQNYAEQPNNSLLTANYSVNIFWAVNMTVSGVTDIGKGSNHSVFLSLSLPLDTDKTLSSSTSIQAGETNTNLQLQKSLPLGTGYGYNLSAQTGTTNYVVAGANYQNDHGYYSAQFANTNGNANYQAEIRGGAIWFSNNLYATRQVMQSFAVVKAEDFANIPVYLNNQQVTKTDAQGYAFIPNLNAYQNNQISIDPNTFPMDAAVNAARINLVPYNRSGIFANFDVRKQKAVLLNLHSPSGQAIPTGAEVHINDGPVIGYVGAEGEAYLTEVAKVNHVTVTWDDKKCNFDFNEPTGEKQPLYRLGNYICY